MPNLLQMTSQEEASQKMHEFYPLKSTPCSIHLDMFLCNYFFPLCRLDKVVPPCSEFCVYIKDKCAASMTQYKLGKWLHRFDCQSLPSKNSAECIFLPDIKEDTVGQLSPGDQHKETSLSRHQRPRCLPHQVEVSPSPNSSCQQLCDANVRFSPDDKVFARHWLTVWSIFCLLSSLLTILVFSCHSTRFQYPEKPIIFLSICYFFYSCGCLMGVGLGRRNISCRQLLDSQVEYVVGFGLEPTWCKINFLMVYFFGSASSLWWVMLTVTWFLSANRQWGTEAIDSFSGLLHSISWGVPALQSILVIVLQKIDTDELTGQCFVGNEDTANLLGFVLVPQLVYLLLGLVFLGLGYSSLLKVRQTFMAQPVAMSVAARRLDTHSIKRMEKLMAKIAVFSVLYVLPTCCVIGSYFADSLKMQYTDRLLRAVHNKPMFSKCVTVEGVTWSDPDCTKLVQGHLPSAELRMLRLFMNLVIGITSGVWIWGNIKTVRVCRRRTDSPAHKPGDKSSLSLVSSTAAPVGQLGTFLPAVGPMNFSYPPAPSSAGYSSSHISQDPHNSSITHTTDIFQEPLNSSFVSDPFSRH